MRHIVLLLCLLLPLTATICWSATAGKPNVVLVMADDHGWHEVGYYDHPHLKTPVLDEMASNGLRFDRFYSAAPVCTPTRASVITGRHPNRMGALTWNYSLRPEEISIAQIMQQAGYATAHFGKWHLGPVRSGSPTNPGAMGFDTWLSHDNFFGYNARFSRNGAPPERLIGESSEELTKEAIKFMKATADQGKPFFIVLWFGSPHGPYAGIDEDLIPYAQADAKLRHRFAEIAAMDRSIGWLRDYLREAELRDNTLVWFTSDNGTPRDVSVGTKLRGFKGQVYEGGIRVPAIIEWPAGIRKARITNVPAVTSDILPTLCDLLARPLPDRPLDGISLVPLIEGRMTERPSPIGFWHYDVAAEEKRGLKPWIDPKLQLGNIPTSKRHEIQFQNFRHPEAVTENFGGAAAIMGNRYKLIAPKNGPLELYDIVADISEKNDLADRQPEVVEEMKRALQKWQRSVELSYAGADYQ
jgi:arylsulfatase